MSKAPSAKQIAARKLFVKRVRAGAFLKNPAKSAPKAVKKSVPSQVFSSRTPYKRGFKSLTGSKESREWYGAIHQAGAKKHRPSVWQLPSGQIKALPETNWSRKAITNPSKKRRKYKTNPMNLKSIFKKDLIIKSAITLAGLFGGAKIESWITEQTWFNRDWVKYAGALNIAFGLVVSAKAKNEKIKVAGVGLIGAGVWSLLAKNAPDSMLDYIPDFPSAPLGMSIPFNRNYGFAADTSLAADARLAADSGLAGVGLSRVPSMRRDGYLASNSVYGYRHMNGDAYDDDAL